MPNTDLAEFARLLIQHVRDTTIQSNDGELRPTATSPVAKRWQKTAQNSEPHIMAKTIIPDIVDDTIFSLLNAIDQGLIHLSFTTSAGKQIDLTKEGLGEMAGWFMGSQGWRSMYSKQRFSDDCADLAH